MWLTVTHRAVVITMEREDPSTYPTLFLERHTHLSTLTLALFIAGAPQRERELIHHQGTDLGERECFVL